MQKIKLKDISEIYSGLSYRRYLDNDGDIFNVIVQRSIKKDGQYGDFEEMSLKKDIKKRYFTQKDDVLMKMTYPYDVVCIKQEGLIISERIAIIRPDKKYDAEFIAHILTNAHIKKQLHERTGGEKLPHTSLKQIKQLDIIIPDIETQQKYSKLLNTINIKIIEDKKQLNFDRNLKEAILNELWSDNK